MNATEEDEARALRNDIRRKAGDLIAALHDLDGSRKGAAFRSPNLSRARDYIEAAVEKLEQE